MSADACEPGWHLHMGVCQRAGYANGRADALADALDVVSLTLFVHDFPGHEELAREMWDELQDDLLPKRGYLSKAAAVIAALEERTA